MNTLQDPRDALAAPPVVVAEKAAPADEDAPPSTSAFTAILALAAPPERVFGELADVENLPRWAGGFCEYVYLVRGRWVALTSLGELFIELEARERTGEVTLWAGWEADRLHSLPLHVAAGGADEAEGGGSRVTFMVPRVANEAHARLCRALCDEWPALAERFGAGVWGEAGL